MNKNYSRNFGILFSFIFFFIFFQKFYISKVFDYYFLSISITLLALSLTKPSWLNPFSFLWSKIGQILGSIITPVIITSIFFLLFTPLSVILKIFRIKLLNVNIKKTKSSYWHERKKELTSMKRQF
jgi:hypothetical protein